MKGDRIRVEAKRTGNGFFAGQVSIFIEDERGHYNTTNTNGHARFMTRDSVYNGAEDPHFMIKSKINGFKRAAMNCWKVRR